MPYPRIIWFLQLRSCYVLVGWLNTRLRLPIYNAVGWSLALSFPVVELFLSGF